jgi:hypothetical protein
MIMVIFLIFLILFIADFFQRGFFPAQDFFQHRIFSSTGFFPAQDLD